MELVEENLLMKLVDNCLMELVEKNLLMKLVKLVEENLLEQEKNYWYKKLWKQWLHREQIQSHISELFWHAQCTIVPCSTNNPNVLACPNIL